MRHRLRLRPTTALNTRLWLPSPAGAPSPTTKRVPLRCLHTTLPHLASLCRGHPLTRPLASLTPHASWQAISRGTRAPRPPTH